jgi:hypothetical protein
LLRSCSLKTKLTESCRVCQTILNPKQRSRTLSEMQRSNSLIL